LTKLADVRILFLSDQMPLISTETDFHVVYYGSGHKLPVTIGNASQDRKLTNPTY